MPVSAADEAALAKAVADLYGEATADVLQLVSKRLAKGVDRDGWAEQKLAELGQLRAETSRVVDRLDRTAPDRIRDALSEATERARRAAAGDLGESLIGTSPRAVEALARETVGQVTATHQRILRSAEDIYRGVITQAAGQVTTGTATRLQSAERALARFAASGVTGFVGPDGRAWELETYVEMALRTATGRAATEGYLDELHDHGHDLVIVSASPEPCEDCDAWEGQVLTTTGSSGGEFPSLDEAYADGFGHPNCTHALEAYIPGFTTPPDRPPKQDRREADAARQEQRRLERGSREWGRRADAAMDPDARRYAADKHREWRDRARDNAERTTARRRAHRERPARPR